MSVRADGQFYGSIVFRYDHNEDFRNLRELLDEWGVAYVVVPRDRHVRVDLPDASAAGKSIRLSDLARKIRDIEVGDRFQIDEEGLAT